MGSNEVCRYGSGCDLEKDLDVMGPNFWSGLRIHSLTLPCLGIYRQNWLDEGLVGITPPPQVLGGGGGREKVMLQRMTDDSDDDNDLCMLSVLRAPHADTLGCLALQL